MGERRRKRLPETIEKIKSNLCKIWGRILIKPISTEEVFKDLGYDYYNIKDRENIYRYVNECQENGESKWNEFDIVGSNEKDRDIIFKKWLDWCYLHVIPYIIFEDGVAWSPKNYEEMRKWLEKIALKKIWSIPKVLFRMAKKGMYLIGRKQEKIPAKELLSKFLDVNKRLPEPKSEKTLEYINIERKCSKCGSLTKELICPLCGSRTE